MIHAGLFVSVGLKKMNDDNASSILAGADQTGRARDIVVKLLLLQRLPDMV